MRSLYSILFRSYMVLALVPLVLLGIMLTVWIASGQIDASLAAGAGNGQICCP